MEIAILIGNGFDLNLGLKTTYNDFLNDYLNKISTNKNIEQFKLDIIKDIDSWGNAEKKFGEYTKNYKIGEKENFMECHDDFIIELAEYLIVESQKLAITEDICQKFVDDFQNIYEGLNAEERENIKGIFNKFITSPYVYNFLVFNYTMFIDEFSENTTNKYKQHKYSNNIYINKINKPRHIHGTVLKEMSLGLNDESQIENMDLFEGDISDIGQLIKQLNNKAFGELNDKFGYELLERSSIYYVYGMSMGETDKLWWERLGVLLSKNPDKRLIIHNYFDGGNPRISRHMIKNKSKCKNQFMAFQKSEIAKKINIDNQIIVTNGNLFKSLKDQAVAISS